MLPHFEKPCIRITTTHFQQVYGSQQWQHRRCVSEGRANATKQWIERRIKGDVQYWQGPRELVLNTQSDDDIYSRSIGCVLYSELDNGERILDSNGPWLRQWLRNQRVETLRRNRPTQVDADGERHYQRLRRRWSIGVEPDGERHYQGCLVFTTLLWVIETKFPPSHDHLTLTDLCREGAHSSILHFLL